MRHPQGNCAICGGSNYYLCDPETTLCYTSNGEPLLAMNEDGELENVVREASHPRVGAESDVPPELETMLAIIENWVSLDKRRKFKLWIENGWNCCLWVNRNSEKSLSVSRQGLVDCVKEAYWKILTLEN